MGKIKENWQLVLLNACLILVVSLTVAFITRANRVGNSTATVDYVDQKDTQIKGYIDTQDKSIENYINTQDNGIKSTIAESCSTTNSRMDRIQAQINTKADKDDYDKVWNLLMENNRKIDETNKATLEILKLVKNIDK